MSFLGLSWSTPTDAADFLQSANIAVANNSARDIILRNRMRRMRGGMNGLGLTAAGISAQAKRRAGVAQAAQNKAQRAAYLAAQKASRNNGGLTQPQGPYTVPLPQPTPPSSGLPITTPGYPVQGSIPGGPAVFPINYPETPGGYQLYPALFGMSGLGANPPRQGTKAWWQWYATSYLPQYYSQQEVQSRIVASPYYTQYGNPYTIPAAPATNYYQYPYGVNQYPQYAANYPYYGYGSPYYNQVQGQYTQWQGEQGAAACAQQGGYYDYAQQSCQAVTGQQQYGNTYGQPGPLPNVVGLPEWQAVSILNGAGYNVWELNRDGVSQGVPPGYSSNRVDISITNGVVTAAAVG